MKPGEIFQIVCAAGSLEAALHDLTDKRLRRLIRWLREGRTTGVRGLVLGCAEIEAANRFVLRTASPEETTTQPETDDA